MSVHVSGVADELRALREQAGLTRRELAELSGISDGTIKSIEYGDSENPRPETLRMLAQGLSTNRISGRQDREQAEGLYARMLGAAGYTPGVEPVHGTAEDLPDDIREQVMELVGTDEGLVRALLADLVRRPDENRRAALRFLAAGLQLSHDARPGRRKTGRP